MAEMPIPVGTTRTFNPTGSIQTITLPPAIYTIEAFGGQGGSYVTGSFQPAVVNSGGLGGRSVGSVLLKEETTFYIHVGQAAPNSNTGDAFNYADYGGGYRGVRTTFREKHVGGGGSSDVRLRADSPLARIIVAGGGGGAGTITNVGHAAIGGNGGGLTGADGQGDINYSGRYYFAAGSGGSQSEGGEGVDATALQRGVISEDGDTHALGYGGKAYSGASNDYAYAGSGGGGWHGGGGGIGSVTWGGTGGGGGSGYIYTADYEGYYPSGCLLHRDTDFLFDYEDTGLVNEQQNIRSGDGVVYITCQALPPSLFSIYTKDDGAIYKIGKVFEKSDGLWAPVKSGFSKNDNIWS